MSWTIYIKSVEKFHNEKLSTDPGYFAKNRAQRYYEQCKSCPIPSLIHREQDHIPIITLPLRINLIRSSILGCSNVLNDESILNIVKMINMYWKQAAICFELVQVKERLSSECLDKEIEREIKTFLTERLKRGPDGRMMHKDERRGYFLDVLLSSFDYENTLDAYDIWFMDMVGHQSQGMCIDRKTHTVLMGERSTKGYDKPTLRPHDCLAKTGAHELGHALDLNHPKGSCFEDGQSQIINRERSNLMQGGVDKKGGGGSFLEQCQICVARNAAEMFVANKMKRSA